MRSSDLTLMEDEALLTLTKQLERAARKLQALLVRAEGTLSDRCVGVASESLAGRQGCRDMYDLLQHVSQLPIKVLRRRVALADKTRPMGGYSAGMIPPKYPAVADAFYAGDLPIETAELIIKTLEAVPMWVDPARRDYAERCMVNQAAGYPECPEPPGVPEQPEQPEQLEALGDVGDESHSDTDAIEGDMAGALDVAAAGFVFKSEDQLPVDCDTMQRVCLYWRNSLDQDGPEPNDEENMSRRYFRIGRVWRGLVPIQGAVLPEVATLLGNMMTSVNAPRSQANQASQTSQAGVASDSSELSELSTPSEGQKSHGVRFVESGECGVRDESVESNESNEGGEGDETHGDLRSSGQKMHDALMVIMQIAGKSAEMPSLGGSPVTVLIQTTQSDLAASLARDIAQKEREAKGRPKNAGAPDAAHETDDINAAWLHGHDGMPVPVSFAAVRHAICSGSTQRVIVNDDGRILRIESPTRTFTPHQRRAIAARDGGCVIPGCTVPATWCEVHHVTEWSRGGATTTDNGVLLCWWHHRSIEVSGWNIRMVNGLPEVRAPQWVNPSLRWRPTRPLLGGVQKRKRGRTRSVQSRLPLVR